MVWLAYLRAPDETCRITGEEVSTQAWMMACICSMLLKLKAGMAYPPLIAFSNSSREFTRPRSLYDTMMFICLCKKLLSSKTYKFTKFFRFGPYFCISFDKAPKLPLQCPSYCPADRFWIAAISSSRYLSAGEMTVSLAVPVTTTRSPTAYSEPSMVILSSDSQCPL